MTKSRIFWLILIVLIGIIMANSLAAVLGLVGALAHALVKPFVIIARFLMVHPVLSVFLFGALAWFLMDSKFRRSKGKHEGCGPKATDPASADNHKERFHRKMRGLAKDLDRSLGKLDHSLKKRGY